MKETNPLWPKLTKPIRDSKINSIIESLDVYNIATWDREFTFVERLLPKQKLISSFMNWISEYVTGLDQFPEKYVCNGNTDSINHVFMERKFQRVFTLENEYSYYDNLCHTLGIQKLNFTESTIDKITENDLVCISFPSAYDGSIIGRYELIKQIQERGIPLYIDMAYCGLTTPFSLNLTATKNTYFAFTFSKTLSIGFNRIGLLFSGKVVPG